MEWITTDSGRASVDGRGEAMTSATFDGRRVVRVLALLLVTTVPAQMGCKTEGSAQAQTSADEKKEAQKRAKTESTEDSETQKASVLNDIELGMTPKEARQLFGEPDTTESGALTYEGAPASQVGFEKLELNFDDERLRVAEFTGEMGEKDPRRQLRELASLGLKAFGKRYFWGLKWKTNVPYDRPLTDLLADPGVELVAVWSTKEHEAVARVGTTTEGGRLENRLTYSTAEKAKPVERIVEEFTLVQLPKIPWLKEQFSSMGALAYTVEKVALLETVGDGDDESLNSDDSRWIRVDYSVENVTDSATSLGQNRVLLMSSQKKMHRPSSAGLKALNPTKAEHSTEPKVPPGESKDQVVVFEVPVEGADRFNLVFPAAMSKRGKPVSMPFGWPTISEQD